MGPSMSTHKDLCNNWFQLWRNGSFFFVNFLTLFHSNVAIRVIMNWFAIYMQIPLNLRPWRIWPYDLLFLMPLSRYFDILIRCSIFTYICIYQVIVSLKSMDWFFDHSGSFSSFQFQSFFHTADQPDFGDSGALLQLKTGTNVMGVLPKKGNKWFFSQNITIPAQK
jgi:hypothetical protein